MAVEINEAIRSLVLKARTDVDKEKENLNGSMASQIGFVQNVAYYDGICDALLALGIIVKYGTGEIVKGK